MAISSNDGEYKERLKRTLDRLFQRSQVGAPYKLSFLETGTLARFIVELTAQNAELALWKKEAMDFLVAEGYEEKAPVEGDWTPFS